MGTTQAKIFECECGRERKGFVPGRGSPGSEFSIALLCNNCGGTIYRLDHQGNVLSKRQFSKEDVRKMEKNAIERYGGIDEGDLIDH